MNQDPERIHDAYAPVHIFPAVAGRCAEVLTDADGYSRCHRAEHGGEGEHHVNDRAWTGRQAAGTVRLRFGVACGPDCIYPDEAGAGRNEAGPGQGGQKPAGQRGARPARRPASHLTAPGWQGRSPAR